MLGEGEGTDLFQFSVAYGAPSYGNLADARFPGQTGGDIPPSPTIENPGQVYPKSDPRAASRSTIPGTSCRYVLSSVTGNPYLFENGLLKLDKSLSELVGMLECEEASTGRSNRGFRYLEKFRSWKQELVEMRDPQSKFNRTSEESGEHASPSEGGLFVE